MTDWRAQALRRTTACWLQSALRRGAAAEEQWSRLVPELGESGGVDAA